MFAIPIAILNMASHNSERSGNLPCFKELSGKIATLKSIRDVPGIAVDNYVQNLDDVLATLRRWSNMVNIVAANPQATEMVSSVYKILEDVLAAKHGYTLSTAGKEVKELHSSVRSHLSGNGKENILTKTVPTAPVAT